MGAVLGQIATGSGGDHLEEQLTTMGIPALSPHSFVEFERKLLTEEIMTAGREKYNHALETSRTHGDDKVPACTMVVDGGWNK